MPTYSNKTYIELIRPLPDFVARDIYDIPFIEPENIDISAMNNGLWLINLKNVSSNDRRPELLKVVYSTNQRESESKSLTLVPIARREDTKPLHITINVLNVNSTL